MSQAGGISKIETKQKIQEEEILLFFTKYYFLFSHSLCVILSNTIKTAHLVTIRILDMQLISLQLPPP